MGSSQNTGRAIQVVDPAQSFPFMTFAAASYHRTVEPWVMQEAYGAGALLRPGIGLIDEMLGAYFRRLSKC